MGIVHVPDPRGISSARSSHSQSHLKRGGEGKGGKGGEGGEGGEGGKGDGVCVSNSILSTQHAAHITQRTHSLNISRFATILVPARSCSEHKRPSIEGLGGGGIDCPCAPDREVEKRSREAK
jgi:hypothetical protein